jgi:hypothetical protein
MNGSLLTVWDGQIKPLFLVCLLLLVSLFASNSYANEFPVLGLLAFPEDGCFDVKEDGQCTWFLLDGTKYVGELKDRKKHGQGTYTYADGSKYVGEYKDGLPNGQGTYTFPDGLKYVGEFKNGKMHGQGTFIDRDGKSMSVSWKDGYR